MNYKVQVYSAIVKRDKLEEMKSTAHKKYNVTYDTKLDLWTFDTYQEAKDFLFECGFAAKAYRHTDSGAVNDDFTLDGSLVHATIWNLAWVDDYYLN